MAKVGLLYPVYAKITTYTPGSAITYGTGAVLGQAVKANTSWNHSNAKLYADNVLAESDNSLLGGTIAVEVDNLAQTTAADVLGLVSSGTTSVEYLTTTAASPYVGFGCIRELVKNGVHSFVGRWYHKVQFTMASDEAKTRAESTEFGTTTLDGEILGVELDSTNGTQFMTEKVFTTVSDAKTWLNTKAGITTTGG